MLHEMRIYTLKGARREAFLTRFRDHVLRLMRRHGFRPDRVWLEDTEETPRLVYTLEWVDEAEREAGWARFAADPEWPEIKRRSEAEGGPMVLSMEELLLRPLDPGRAS